MDFVSNYVLLDIETTGLSPTNDEIIEIGALKVVDNEIVDTFSTLIKPSCVISDYISNLTGITNDMVSNSPDIYDVLISFNDFIGDNVIVAHNAKFDVEFLKNNYTIYLGIPLNNRYIDTLYLSQKYIKNLKNYKLKTLANHFNISYDGAHRSLNDCEITKKVYDSIQRTIHINS